MFKQFAVNKGLQSNTSFAQFVRLLLEEVNKQPQQTPPEIREVEVIKEIPTEVIKEVEKVVYKTPENAVCIPITSKMEKCLQIRETKKLSESMDHMVKQAISFCTNKPTGNLFTSPW